MKITELKREDYEQVEVNSSRWLSLDNLKNEHWKDIKDFEGLYQVSNYGRVKSLARKTNNYKCKYEKILKVGINADGYHVVSLCKEYKKYTRMVHILVAQAFIFNPYNKPCVDHDKPVEKDYCNNCVYNLRWATQSENMLHCSALNRIYQNGKPPTYIRFGKEHCSSKPIIQYDLNNNFIKQWWSVADIGRESNFSSDYIRHIIRTDKPIAYGYKWEYGIYKKER